MKKLSHGELVDIKKYNAHLGYLNGGVIEDLLHHIDAIEAEKDKLIDNVGQLQKELQQEREGKRLALPKILAEALKVLQWEGLSNYKIISLTSVTNQLYRDYPSSVIDALKIVEMHSINYDVVSALAKGYTIEEPPSVESRIQSTIEAELKRQGITSPAPIDYVAKCLTDLISPIVVKDEQQHEKAGS